MEISGNTGVYLMYAYARSAVVLRKAKAMGIAVAGEPADAVSGTADSAIPVFPQDPETTEHALLRQLGAWPDTLYAASAGLMPSAICHYSHTLAVLFNPFYGACPILSGSEASTAFRVWLTGKFQETLGDALNVLGVPAPERL